jgi:hypothetical protein
MSSLSLIEATPQRVSLQLERKFNSRENLGIFFYIIFLFSLGALLVTVLTDKTTRNITPDLLGLIAVPVGMILVFYAISLVVNYLKMKNDNITIFVFDKNDNKIWIESHNLEGLKDRKLFGDLTKVSSATLQEEVRSGRESKNHVVSFLVYFVRDSGTSIVLSGKSIRELATQSKRQRFDESLENARNIVRTLNNFLGSDAM